MAIKATTQIEDLVKMLPAAVKYLAEKGVMCIACGEPIWGSLQEAAKAKGFENEEIDHLVKDLNKLMDQLERR